MRVGIQSESPYKQIGIDSYGASITTMDEIFLKVTHQDEVEQESEKSLRSGLRTCSLKELRWRPRATVALVSP